MTYTVAFNVNRTLALYSVNRLVKAPVKLEKSQLRPHLVTFYYVFFFQNSYASQVNIKRKTHTLLCSCFTCSQNTSIYWLVVVSSLNFYCIYTVIFCLFNLPIFLDFKFDRHLVSNILLGLTVASQPWISIFWLTDIWLVTDYSQVRNNSSVFKFWGQLSTGRHSHFKVYLRSK